LKLPLTEIAFTTRQAVGAMNQYIHEMSMVKHLQYLVWIHLPWFLGWQYKKYY
jgi:hypothetical protein